MVSIGICGASGCGKSLLVRQLAALNCAPAFLEGEIGFFPPEVIEDISDKSKKPVKLFRFFSEMLDERFKVAQRISKSKILCFVDGCIASVPAHYVLEKEESVADLKKIAAKMKTDVDVIILLVCSTKTFRRNIKIRGRSHEQNAEYMSRSNKVQKEFRKLLRGKENVLVLNRDKYDFSDYDDLQKLNKNILSFANKVKKY